MPARIADKLFSHIIQYPISSVHYYNKSFIQIFILMASEKVAGAVIASVAKQSH